MKTVLRLINLFTLLAWATPTVAQQPVLNNHLTGKVLDATTAQALPFASVAIFKQINGKDSLLTGAQTDEQGAFIITNVPTGSLLAKVTFVGYQNLNKAIL